MMAVMVAKRDSLRVAVLHHGALCYDTPITDDVIGHLDFGEVAKILNQISMLPTD